MAAAFHTAAAESTLTTLPFRSTGIDKVSPALRAIDTIHAFIEDERVRNFCFLANHSHAHMRQKELLFVSFADDQEVERLCSSGKITRSAHHDATWYTFTEIGEQTGPIRTVAITCTTKLHDIDDMKIDDLEIFDPLALAPVQKTSKAADWIRTTYDWSEFLDWEMRKSVQRYYKQQLWWDRNGKHFPLVDLPLELRKIVYLYTIGPVIVPELHERTVVLGRGLRRSASDKRNGSHRDPEIEPPNMGIMGVCKTVREEAREVAERDTIKRFFSGDSDLSRALGRRSQIEITYMLGPTSIPGRSQEFLRHIQLEMTATRYFQIIGIHPTRQDPWNRYSNHLEFHLSALAEISTLQSLDFRFISPKSTEALCPWSTYGEAKSHSCQKIWIDWFFVFAWDILEHFSNNVKFSLSGCVKHSTRKKWEHLLNDTWIDRTGEMFAQQKRIVREKRTYEPISCTCKNECGPGEQSLFQCDDHELPLIEGIKEARDQAYWNYED